VPWVRGEVHTPRGSSVEWGNEHGYRERHRQRNVER
jgi:hypothetical protein